MKWSYLHVLFDKFVIGSLIAVYLIPILADLMRVLGLNYEHLRITILGGILFMVGFATYRIFCPSVIEKYSKDGYINWALEMNVNIFEKLKLFSAQSEVSKRDLLGDKVDILYPIEKGLMRSREECIKECVAIEYDLNNISKPLSLYIISILILISIVMVNWLPIERLIRVLG